jgi:hypothetical protein
MMSSKIVVFSNRDIPKIGSDLEIVYVFDGLLCETKELFLKEGKRIGLLPDYCGLNWDAFEESLIDLILEKVNVRCVFNRSDKILSGEASSEIKTLLDILVGAEKKAAREAVGSSICFVWQLLCECEHIDAVDVAIKERSPFRFKQADSGKS